MAKKKKITGKKKTVIEQYITDIQQNLRARNATENTHRPALKTLLESLNKKITATNEPKHRTDCGAPDMVILRKKGNLPLGHIEAKDIGVSLTQVQKSEQLRRYRKALPNLILTDYLQFRWFVNGKSWGDATLGTVNARTGKITADQRGIDATQELLDNFLKQDPTPISKPKDLAKRMANLGHLIRGIVIEAFATKQASPLITDLRKAMAQALIPDLEEPDKTGQFADIYAQTLTYGLFAARCNHSGPKKFTRQDAASEIPRTNPFLRRLFTTITGPDLDSEPYAGFVDELVSVLAETDIAAVLKNFGSAEIQKDPVLHFYETFLATYDPKLRESRGVYYTPEPVVQYIVRSVDHLLKTNFGIAEGLADTGKITYEHVSDEKSDGKHIVENREAHRTIILDPATGTGTFLYVAVSHIRARFEKTKRAGMWSGYVRDHLLPRIFGFELLMAPYAVAHFKLGMQLAGLDMPENERDKWAYDFNSDDRLGVYLTNTLELLERHTQELLGPYRIISDEANEARRIKRELPILVVLGNPPYSGHSYNKGEWINNLLKGRLPGNVPTQSYYQVDGKPLGERNTKWLQNDYVKFIRWGQWRIDQSGQGILAFITSHSYLDNPTFRGMRQSLMRSFDEIYILDLHGNINKREISPDGTPDRNVFDIKDAGVAIGLFVKKPKGSRQRVAQVFHTDLWGLREVKYDWLLDHSVANTDWGKLTPAKPFYLFRQHAVDEASAYLQWPSIIAVLPINSVGVVTGRDRLVIDCDRNVLRERMNDFVSTRNTDIRVGDRYLRDGDGLDVRQARERIVRDGAVDAHVTQILYRPFDRRYIFYHDAVIERPRREAMPHMLAGENVALASTRQTKDQWDVFSTTTLMGHKGCSRYDIGSIFPLYLYPNVGKVDQHTFEQWPEGENGRRPNLDPGFINDLAESFGLEFITDGRGDLESTFGPEDVLHYIYAVFHCPTYRERYAELLKLDFPRVPLTSDVKQFVRLCNLGQQIMALHLLESENLTGESVGFDIRGNEVVERGYPKYVPPGAEVIKAGKAKLKPDEHLGRVYINPKQFFEGVEPEVWEFQIGGYQVAEKWLKDRRQRTLSHDDISYYTRIIEALRSTISLMEEIDKAIPEWPMS